MLLLLPAYQDRLQSSVCDFQEDNVQHACYQLDFTEFRLLCTTTDNPEVMISASYPGLLHGMST